MQYDPNNIFRVNTILSRLSAPEIKGSKRKDKTVPTNNATAPGSHRVLIKGIEQRYHVAGKGPLCIVHPDGPGIDWTYLKMRSIEQHLTMLYIEPIGTGTSGCLTTHPKGYTVERYCQQLEGFVDALDLSGFFLLGHSHGGFVVQQYAIAHPERMAGLIVYSSSAVTGPQFITEAGQNIAAFAQRNTGTPEAREVAQAWASIPRSINDDDFTRNLQGLLPAYFADHHNAGFSFHELRAKLQARFVIGDAEPFDVRQALAKLRLPALILTGEHDFMCGPKWANILQSALANSQLVIFRHSGHMAHIEQPNEFSGAIGAFVFRHRPGRIPRPSLDGRPYRPTDLPNR
jgi:pimeloyl-ACP methyl ester carboxylesterase